MNEGILQTVTCFKYEKRKIQEWAEEYDLSEAQVLEYFVDTIDLAKFEEWATE